MTTRRAGLLAALGALAALGVAYWAQDFRGLAPCPLCLIERWPYRVVVGLGLLAAISPRRLGRAVLLLAALTLLAGAGVALLHVGVEHGWWPSPLPECNGMLTPGAPLPAIPAVPCNKPVYLFAALPLSMALLDLLYAAAFALALLGYAAPQPKRAI